MFVGFFEDIVQRPVALLREVFSFLGVDPDVDVSRYPVEERILPGPDGELSSQLEGALRHLLGGRTDDLVTFLHDTFSLTPPPAWQRTLGSGSEPSAVKWDFTEADL